jgi:hypothetical protein
MKRYCSSRAEAALAEMQIKGFARRDLPLPNERKLADDLVPVPVANAIPLAVDRESGNAAAQWWICAD